MRKTRLVLSSVAALFIAGGITYVRLADRLPPRTAIKVARFDSGLPVPADAKALGFEDRWMAPNGDGSTFITLALSSAEARRLARRANQEGYRPISEVHLSERVKDALPHGAHGVARSSGTPTDGSSVVVDTTNDRLIVHRFIGG